MLEMIQYKVKLLTLGPYCVILPESNAKIGKYLMSVFSKCTLILYT